ncbi:hypothetical protein BV898_17781 [Hypsibius exemplaris]|uniref:Receptor ligand binding region domain-containing protein n=1 Tax=Hypsibius exemplaris TaxID=2072580 RepID=A0A9X6NIJ2_HYPEX|nr:hypothetical protein BV898_17781 [Hypsibius exemplaris]
MFTPFVSFSTATLYIAIRQFVTSSAVIQVEIASPGFVPPGGGNGALAYHGPAIQAAVAECNKIYLGIFHFTLTFAVRGFGEDVNDTSAALDNGADLLANWYWTRRRDPNGISVVISPGSYYFTDVHQLTGHWNIPCISTLSSTRSLYTLQPAPVMVVTSFVTPIVIGQVFAKLLSTFGWTTVFVVIDETSVPVYEGILLSLDLALRLSTSRTKIDLKKHRIASNKLPSFRVLLNQFRNSSRVMVYLGRAEQMRRLMIDAESLNMTKGEFVYICDEPYPFPKSYGIVKWFTADGKDNDMARSAFRSLLVVHPHAALNWSDPAIQSRVAKFRAGSRDLFNITVELFDQVLNETLATHGPVQLFDGAWLSRRFLNRSFNAGTPYDIYIDETGFRRVTLAVAHFTGNDSIREDFLLQSSINRLGLEVLRNISDSWPGGNWPPPNEPFCGYTNSNPDCRKSSALWYGGLAGILMSFIMLNLAVVFWIKKRLDRTRSMEIAWKLKSADLVFSDDRDD